MKQNITVKQLNGLSEKGKDAYFTFWHRYEKKYGIYSIKREHIKEINGGIICRKSYALLSIGQMIEFLVNDYDKTGNRSLNMEQTIDGWSLWEWETNGKELCDALWKACKEVLEI